MVDEPLGRVAPQVAATLRAVYAVSRAANTGEQRAAAARITNRWTVLALDGGWTTEQIAGVVGLGRRAVSRRAAAHRTAESTMPPLLGVVALQPAPTPAVDPHEIERRRLIGSALVAALVGCVPGSVSYWTQSRGVGFQWSPGGGRRLYDRDEVMIAAQARPTVKHRKHRPPRSRPVTPPRGLTGTKSTWTSTKTHVATGGGQRA